MKDAYGNEIKAGDIVRVISGPPSKGWCNFTGLWGRVVRTIDLDGLVVFHGKYGDQLQLYAQARPHECVKMLGDNYEIVAPGDEELETAKWEGIDIRVGDKVTTNYGNVVKRLTVQRIFRARDFEQVFIKGDRD